MFSFVESKKHSQAKALFALNLVMTIIMILKHVLYEFT